MLLYRAIVIFINFLELLILVRIIFSFMNIRDLGIVTKFVYELTEPILGPSRNLIGKLNINTGMFDFSPIVSIFILRIVQYIASIILL